MTMTKVIKFYVINPDRDKPFSTILIDLRSSQCLRKLQTFRFQSWLSFSCPITIP
jgi:hypothetical protein